MAIVSRFITIVLGYFAGLFTFFLALISIFGVLAAMSSKPGLWMLGPMSPAILISAPAVLIFAILAAVLLSLIPFLLILLPSEFFGWKSPVGYCLIASLSAAGAYASVSPRFIWDHCCPVKNRINSVGYTGLTLDYCNRHPKKPVTSGLSRKGGQIKSVEKCRAKFPAPVLF